MLEDKELTKKAKQGDAEAFGLLYDKHLNQIYRFVYLKVSSKQIAEDLTQQVFLSAWQNINSYQQQGFPFTSWLYRIARNAVIDHYRTRRSNVDLEAVAEVASSFDLVGELEVKLELEKIKSALVGLPADYQDVLVMRFIEELSHQEIAAALDKSEGAVRVLQHRAINSLKKILNKT
ncbi:MAG: RNA polymerase sigma factor [Candidatus Brennerbacteria bacterium]|nr:RNA polymerase sigma factor [Candidatus Brennerbacteria bacterium]